MSVKKDPRIDAYIDGAADFARPILKRIRAAVHEACPDCVEEIKWSHPAFTHNGMLAGMVAFKAHCAFHYWKGSLVMAQEPKGAQAIAQLRALKTLSDLPPKASLVRWTKKAMALNDAGVTERRAPRSARKPIKVPADLSTALERHARAQATFTAFPPGKQRDYIEWITEAKSDETRQRRLATSIAWLADGKSRNWKYEKA